MEKREIDEAIQKKLETLSQNLAANNRGEDSGSMIPAIHEALENKPSSSKLLLLFWRRQNTGIPGTSFSLKEQFYTKEKMLDGQLEEVLLSVKDAHGAPLCIRPNFGTTFLPAMLGLEFEVFDEAYPWMKEHLSKKDFADLSFPDLRETSMMKRALEYIEYFIETVPPEVHVYMPDTQGPYDLAHLIYGNQLFIEMYDDPVFVHELMKFTTELYIKATDILKDALGEDRNSCYHGHALILGIHMHNGGVRISEDTGTLISPEHIDEFVIPYDKQILDYYSGGFIHYCGVNDHLLDRFLSLEGVRAINFGNPEKHDFDETMRKFREHGVCCFGKWPKYPEETTEAYFQRILKVTDGGKKGIILHVDSEEFEENTADEIWNIWENLFQ